MSKLSFKVMQEKKKGLGEDSDPILLCLEDLVVLGVFDGMGGAGGAECQSDYGDGHTKAYVASRIIRNVVEQFVKDNKNLVGEDLFAKQLKSAIKNRYKEEMEKYPPKTKSGLRSGLIKEYPTTMALTCIRLVDNSRYIIDSYWVGDSRNYLWSKNGLFQISVDDLKGNLDPLENLHEDAPMSNCIQADGPFEIRHKRIDGFKKLEKFVVFSATDGCFGYFPSPMDFERILYYTLDKSKSIDEWGDKLKHSLAEVTADDISFSLIVMGCSKFEMLKKEIKRSICSKKLKKFFWEREKCNRLKKKIESLQKELNKKSDELDSQIKSLWPEYKDTYLKYMKDYEKR